MKRLSLAALGSAFVVGTVGAVPASAATFNFSGDLIGRFEGSTPLPTQGSYTVADDILENLLQQPLDPSDPSSFDPNARKVNNAVSAFVFNSGAYGALINQIPPQNSFVTTYLSQGGQLPSGTPVFEVYTNSGGSTSYLFDLQVAGQPSLANCLVDTCGGSAFFDYPLSSGYSGSFTQTPASVPEPTGAIGELALGVTGAFMLVRKRKISSSRSA